MSSECVQKAIEYLNGGVAIEKLRELVGVELTAAELTEVRTGLSSLAERESAGSCRR